MYKHTYNKEIEKDKEKEKEVDLIFLLVGVRLLDHFFPDDFGEVDRETIAAITAHVRERDHGAMTTYFRERDDRCHYDTCARE